MNQIMILSLITSLILVGGLVLVVFKQKQKIKRMQCNGLGLIKDIKTIINCIQQHRGWSSAYIRGDASVLGKLEALQQTIKTTSNKVLSEFEIKQYDRWLGYTEHWARLSKSNLTLSADNSFKQHTQLVGNMLYLLEDIAEKNHLTADALPEFPMINLLWRELLEVAECVGQSRALGTGVATVNEANRVEKIRLGFLRQKITEMSETTYVRLQQYANRHHVSDQNRTQSNTNSGTNLSNKSDIKPDTRSDIKNSQLNTLIAQASQRTRHLCSVIENDLVEKEVIKIDAKQYFELATQAIEALNQIFDMEMKKIEAYFQTE